MKKILIVDDIEANRKLLRGILSTIGAFEYCDAVNGKDAVEQVEKCSPDLVLMDISMPEMNGYQSATAIKSITGNNYTPIIFVTALSAEVCLANALTAGGDDFISKPLSVSVLESKINAHLRIRELNQQLNSQNEKLVKLNQHLTREQELVEHFFASALQKSFLDKDIINYHMSPMSAFNGDLLLAQRGPKGGLYLVMGDFTGHGLTAAMGTLPVAMIFFKMASKGVAVEEIARELNSQLRKLLPLGMFFAATILELNPRGDILSVWMGGMPESFWFNTAGSLKGAIAAQHMPLGILEDAEFDATTEVFSVEHGDKLYLYSDGLTEAQHPDGEMFGYDRLQQCLVSGKTNRILNVLSTLADFIGVEDQSDDITLVELTCQEIPAAPSEADTQITNNMERALPWHFSISLSDDDIRRPDSVTELSNILGAMPALAAHKGVLHVVLSEMYANSIDHSILELDSLQKTDEEQFVEYYRQRDLQLQALQGAYIKFDFSFYTDNEQQRLQIRISDSGKGYQGHTTLHAEDRLHGRGMTIINNFCDEVMFSADGKTLNAVFRLSA